MFNSIYSIVFKYFSLNKLKSIAVILTILNLLALIYVLIINSFFNKPSNITVFQQNTCNQINSLGGKQQCWDDLVDLTIEQQGLEAAFDLVSNLYAEEPEFAADCHGYTHNLGITAYKLFSEKKDFKLTPKVSSCGFGFYHAFMETLVRSTKDLGKAREFCDYVGRQSGQNELSRLSCFHGIGHGLLEDIPNPVLKGDAQAIIKKPLDICIKVSKTDIEEYRCASGVFNVLAIYYQNPKTGLKVEKSDPYVICNSQTKKYPKKACYDQMNSLVLSLTNRNLLSAAKFAEKIQNDEFAREAMHGIAGAYGQNNVGKINYDDIVKTCQNVQQRLKLECIQGFLLGVIEGGKPSMEYIEGAEFCSSESLSQQDKTLCFNTLAWNVSVTYPEKFSGICSYIKQKYGYKCNVN